MAQYFTDFSEYRVGSSPDDWAEEWVTGGQRMSVEREGSGPRAFQFLRHEILNDDRRAYAWRRVCGGASEVEIVARVRADDAGARFGVVGRGAGHARMRENEEGVVAEFRSAEEDFTTRSYSLLSNPPASGEEHTGISIGDSRFGWKVNTWYWIRLRLSEGEGSVECYSRAWAGDPVDEPSQWIHSHGNALPLEAGRRGWVGVTGQRVAGVRDYDVFGVGTEGDVAPTQPVS